MEYLGEIVTFHECNDSNLNAQWSENLIINHGKIVTLHERNGHRRVAPIVRVGQVGVAVGVEVAVGGYEQVGARSEDGTTAETDTKFFFYRLDIRFLFKNKIRYVNKNPNLNQPKTNSTKLIETKLTQHGRKLSKKKISLKIIPKLIETKLTQDDRK